MIGCIEVKCVAAKPNFPLVPLFAFKGSPSSLRLLDVPKSIGEWEINSVRVVVKYPDNTAFEKSATRTGNVWVATIDGCDTTGKVTNGYEILADGVDENGSEIDGYVLGAGDIYILDRDASVDPDVQKFYVKYCEDIPSNPSKGDLILVDVNANGVTQIKIWNGEEWKSQTLFTKTSQLENDSGFITASAIPSQISAFENDVGYITSAAIPSQISAFENDVGYLTAGTLPSNLSDFNNDVGYITASASAITNKRDLDDLTIKGNPQGAGSWFIVNGNALDWYEDQQLWYSNVDGDVIDIIDSGAYMFRVNNYPVGNFTLGDDFTAAIEYDGKTYEIVGYADTLAKTSELPSKTSDLVNDSGYVTASAIPSNVSQLANDVGYLTASSSAFVAKRDKVDMSTYSYAPWTLNGDTYTWDATDNQWNSQYGDHYLVFNGNTLEYWDTLLGRKIALGQASQDALSVVLNYTGGAGEGVLGTATRQSVLYTDGELAKKGYVDAQIYSLQQSIAQTSFTASTALDNANSALAALADKRNLMDADVYIYAPWYIEEWEIELDWNDGYWDGWYGSPEPDSVELRFSNGTWTLSVNSTEWGTSTAGEKSMQLTFTNGQDTLTLRRSGIYTTGSDVYATEGYVNAQIGTINTALDTINGEVI